MSLVLPGAVVGVEVHYSFSKAEMSKEVVKSTDTAFAPLPHSPASSVKKLSCLGIVSLLILKTLHLRGTRK